MRCTILAFVAGAAWLQTRARLPAAPGWILAAVLLIFLASRFTRAKRRLATGIAGGFAIGYFWAALVAQQALAPALAADDEGRDVVVVGTIDSLPGSNEQGTRFNFAVEQIVTPAAMTVPPHVALSWYAGFRGERGMVPAVQPGERWRLKVRLQRPHGNANPYCFDYELWLLEQGIRATGYVRAEGPNARLDGFVASPHNVIERCRAALRDRILRALAGREYAGVIVALVIGDQRGIDQSDWQVFTRTGISHLISISGLHITMIAGLVALGCSWLWRHSCFLRGAQLPLRLPAQKVGALAGVTAALIYVLLAGFGVPAQRTLYMLCVVAIAVLTGRLASVTHVLALAAGVVVLIDPWAVMWPGFWLSFGAVAVILYASVGRTAIHKRQAEAAPRGLPLTRRQRFVQGVQAAVLTQYAVTLGLVPLTMLLFAQVSIVSPIANAVAIPVVSLLVTPLALAGGLLPAPFGAPLLAAAHELVRWLAAALQWFSAAPLAVWTAPTPPWWQFAPALAGTLWLLAPRGWPSRWLGLATWVPLLAAQPDHPPSGGFHATAFDVGQGMAVLVETAHHRLLYDTGPAYGPDSNAGSRVIVPYLRARGIDRLDGIVVSHGDSDHSGGALSVLQGVRTEWLLSSLAPRHPVALAAPRHLHCAAGQHWTWDGVRFDVLHPLAASYADAAQKTNARSCTIRVSAPGGAMLLAGDIEAPQEAALVARAGPLLKADMLLAPHHGSGTSSTPAFLAAVHPAIAIFQVGYRNRYHHPKPEVFQRYGELGVQRVRTDGAGAAELDVGTAIGLTSYRDVHPRYWYGH